MAGSLWRFFVYDTTFLQVKGTIEWKRKEIPVDDGNFVILQ
jgi:hypothetical protein